MLGPSNVSVLPDILKSEHGVADDGAEQEFFMYIFKVQPCPKRGAHDWSSCPYAHPKEKARRRDPRVYKYASTPCPESLKGMNCGRGVGCPYAHSVYEYWLHPSRFRTQMCKKGNQCNRTLCFFAHSACELRFPDTTDDLEAAALDAAAASATAGALPLVAGAPAATGSLTSYPSGVVMMPGAVASNNSSSLGVQGMVGLGTTVSDASSMQLTGSYAGGSSFGAMPGQQQVQGQLLRDDGSGYNLGGSDPNLRISGLAQQQQSDMSGSLSEPLPRLAHGSAVVSCNPGSAGWLQLAAASQLPASQILSSIRPPGAQQLQVQQPEQQMGMMPAATAAPMDLRRISAPSAMLLNGGSGATASHMPDGLQRLSSGLGAMSLVDDSSTSSCLTVISGDQQYLAALNACAAAAATGRTIDLSNVLQQPVASPPRNSSNIENFMLLQQLQQQQQQQLAKLGSTASSASCTLAAGSRQSSISSGPVYMNLSMGGGSVTSQASGSWSVRMA